MDQCQLICALKHCVRTIGDDERLTDDTVSMVMTYRYRAEAQPIETAAVYQYISVNRGDPRNQGVQAICRRLIRNRVKMRNAALTCYWSWMEYMKGIWNQ